METTHKIAKAVNRGRLFDTAEDLGAVRCPGRWELPSAGDAAIWLAAGGAGLPSCRRPIPAVQALQVADVQEYRAAAVIP